MYGWWLFRVPHSLSYILCFRFEWFINPEINPSAKDTLTVREYHQINKEVENPDCTS
jgi:hypothetical protein